MLERLRVPTSRLRVFPSEAAAWAAAADGDGIAPAVAHVVMREVQRGTLVHLPVEGTPIDLLWYVSTLPGDRCSPAANKLRRFLATPGRDAGDAPVRRQRARIALPSSRLRDPLELSSQGLSGAA